MSNLDFKIFDKELWFYIDSDQWKATIIHKFLCSGRWSWFSDCDLSSKESNKERYAIMQYTWANDINWNKIYHHDIVHIAWCKTLFEVLYSNNVASYVLKHIEWDMENDIETFAWYHLVVVWNKYNQSFKN